MNAPVQLETLRPQRENPLAMKKEEDYSVDFFSVRGFQLAKRLAETFGMADSVPEAYRLVIKQKGRNRGQDQFIENPAALGNWFVAIETAQALRMSITAVVMNSYPIEGKLSWSAQFHIAAVNSCRRFTYLRYDIKQRGRAVVPYKEKGPWNDEARRYDTFDRTAEIDDIVCIAWACPAGVDIPPKIATLEQAKAAGLPVIESTPVSIRMAVEEGWYHRNGSKWQTELKIQMLQYRAGAFFGRVNCPDILLGMGRTTEEWADMQTVNVDGYGNVTDITDETVTRNGPTPMAEVVQRAADNSAAVAAEAADRAAAGGASSSSAGPTAAAPAPAPAPAPAAAPAQHQASATPAFDTSKFKDRMTRCTSRDALDVLGDDARSIEDPAARADLLAHYEACLAAMEKASTAGAPAQATAQKPIVSRARPVNSKVD